MKTWFFSVLLAVPLMAQSSSVLNVKDFGATGDGSTDDQAAITAASAAAKRNGGGTVYFPQGTYMHSDLIVFYSNTTVKGDGTNATILKALNPVRSAIVFMKASNCSATQFKVVGSRDRRLQNDESSGILLIDASHCTVTNVAIDGGLSTGIMLHNSHDVQVTNNDVRNTMADGIHSVAGSSQILIANNTAFNTGDDSFAAVAYAKEKQTSDVTIRNNTSIKSRARGATCIGSANCIIEGNTIESPAAHGIAVAFEQSYHTHRPSHAVVSGNTITGALGQNFNAILVDNADDVTLSRNTVSNSHSVYIHNSTGVQVSDMTISGSQGPAILARDSNDVRLQRNSISGSTGPGILMERVTGGEVSENNLQDVGQAGDAARGDIDIAQSPGLKGRSNISNGRKRVRIVGSSDTDVEVRDQ